jgi:hypothetical protein
LLTGILIGRHPAVAGFLQARKASLLRTPRFQNHSTTNLAAALEKNKQKCNRLSKKQKNATFGRLRKYF